MIVVCVWNREHSEQIKVLVYEWLLLIHVSRGCNDKVIILVELVQQYDVCVVCLQEWLIIIIILKSLLSFG